MKKEYYKITTENGATINNLEKYKVVGSGILYMNNSQTLWFDWEKFVIILNAREYSVIKIERVLN
jgi:archaellum component FlaF (FlaF/FlaG flagellin family)